MTEESRIFIENCRKSDTERDKGLTVPPEVECFYDIVYGSDEKRQVLDVYMPRERGARLPVIVSVHGGGWVYGDKEVYRYYCMDLSRRGFAVINFTYRLAPDFKHPAPVEDTALVFGWLLRSAEKYGFDTDNIFAVGDSAGAHILGLFACVLTDPEYGQRYAFSAPAELKLRGLGLNCGIYSVSETSLVGTLREYIPEGASVDIMRELTIPDHITKAFPPCFIMTSHDDFLRDEPEALMKALESKGVRYSYRKYGDSEHRLYHVFHCNIRTAEAAIANDEECGFFRELMSGREDG